MTTEFNGGPVLGGTFPALIWHDFMPSAIQIDREPRRASNAPAAASAGARRRLRRPHDHRRSARHHDDRQRHGRRARGRPPTPSAAPHRPAPPHAVASPSPRRRAAPAPGAGAERRRRRPQRSAGRRPGGDRPRGGAGGVDRQRRSPAPALARGLAYSRGAGALRRTVGCAGATAADGLPGPPGDQPQAGGSPAHRTSVTARTRGRGGRRRRAASDRGPAAAGATCRVARRAEAPRQLDRPGDADPRTGGRSSQRRPGRRPAIATGPRAQVGAVVVEPDPERLGELAGPRAQVGERGRSPRRARISSTPVERLERADQHRGADALRLADRVEQGVDAVGAVDVGAPRRPEQGARARRQRRRRRGRRARARGRPRSRRSRRWSPPCATVQPTRSRATSTHRPRVEGRRPAPARRRRSGHAAPARRAPRSSCSRTRGSAVPPSQTLDSSHERWASTS